MGGLIEIDNYSSVNAHVLIYGAGGVRIGSYVRIATHTVIVESMHRYQRTEISIKQQGIKARCIVIEDEVWIGAGVTILDEVEIGRGSLIGAVAVLTKNVEPFSIMSGIPARLLKHLGNVDLSSRKHV